MTTTAYSHLADAQASEFEQSALFLDLKNRTHEHLLSRIEELGAEFGRWSQAAIAQFVLMELDSFIRLHSVPVNEQEALQVARALTRELTGLGPLQPLLEDPGSRTSSSTAMATSTSRAAVCCSARPCTSGRRACAAHRAPHPGAAGPASR